jgi:hypothetical protein
MLLYLGLINVNDDKKAGIEYLIGRQECLEIIEDIDDKVRNFPFFDDNSDPGLEVYLSNYNFRTGMMLLDSKRLENWKKVISNMKEKEKEKSKMKRLIRKEVLDRRLKKSLGIIANVVVKRVREVLVRKEKRIVSRWETLVRTYDEKRFRKIKLKVWTSKTWCDVISGIGKRVADFALEKLKEEETKIKRKKLKLRGRT